MNPRPGNDPMRPKRKYSIWSVLAPIALLVLVFATFNALGESCVIKKCPSKDATDSAKKADAKKPKSGQLTKDGRPVRTYRVQKGDSLSLISEKFDISENVLRACNPKLDIETLQPGALLKVNEKACSAMLTKINKAPAGANPDPLAGETSDAQIAKSGKN